MTGYSLENSLIGREIFSFKNDLYEIAFDTNWGEVKWKVEGDCCSSSWIESVDVLPGLVDSVRAIELEEIPFFEQGTGLVEAKSNLQEYHQFYGIEINTYNGTGVIDFRNSSNGYYGGWMNVSYVEKHPILKLFSNNVKMNELIEWGTPQLVNKAEDVILRIMEHFNSTTSIISLQDLPKNEEKMEIWADEFMGLARKKVLDSLKEN